MRQKLPHHPFSFLVFVISVSFYPSPHHLRQDVDGCHYSKNPNEYRSYLKYRDGLSLSRFSIFSRGDDPASSRMYDALELGTPQILLSDLYMGIVAAFQCLVDWDRLVYQINEKEFQADPIGVMGAALKTILGPQQQQQQQQIGGAETETGKQQFQGSEHWRQMWEATQKHRDDLLWHTPNSRVGHNLLQEIGRRCTSGPRKAVWDDYTRRRTARHA